MSLDSAGQAPATTTAEAATAKDTVLSPAGWIALGLVDAYADVYLTFGGTDLTNYSIIVTFALLVGVLAVRPLGLFGRPA